MVYVAVPNVATPGEKSKRACLEYEKSWGKGENADGH
jgi:hypothetical protein